MYKYKHYTAAQLLWEECMSKLDRLHMEFKAEDSNNIKMTLKTTMNIEDWKKFKQQLQKSEFSTSFPIRIIIDQISELVNRADTHFMPEWREDKL